MELDSKIFDVINNSTNVAIFTHIRPDGDALGSATALRLALLQLNKNVDIYCDSIIPDDFEFLTGIFKLNKQQLSSYDTAIAVDCSDLNRLGKYADLFQTIEHSLKIDHHKAGVDFAQVNFVDSSSPSTAEILFFVFTQLNIQLDQDIAQSLYTGVATDTGCFMHANTTSQTHLIASALIKFNFDLDRANYNLFKRRSVGQVRLQKIALDHMKFYLNNHLCITYLNKPDFEESKCNSNETFGIVDIVGNIDKVEIGIVISEDKPNLYVVSIRSRGNIDVSKLAESFGGGGHKNAAGCNIFGTYKSVIHKIVKIAGSLYDGVL